MQNELVSPNLHVVLIHFPLAFLIFGTLVEFFSFLWPRSGFRAAGRWMILVGALSAIPATFSGIYALRAVAHVDGDASWVDVKSTSAVLSDPVTWNMLRRHVLFQSIASGVAAFLVLVWLASSDRLRRSLHVILVLLMALTCSLLVYGAWFGGESVYRKGVGVGTTQPTSDAAEASTMPVSWTTAPTRVELMFPPVELHIILAGIATAFAVVSIGLSFRRISATGELVDEPIVTADPIAGRAPARTVPTSVEMVRTFNPDIEVVQHPLIPAGRFWMLTFLLALLALLGGLFVIARDADILESIRQTPKQTPQLLWNQIKPEPGTKDYRHLAHGISGSAIVAVPIILALLVRFAPREKLILSFFTLLLVCAVAAQIWLGVLLWLDTSQGSLTHFNPPAAGAAHSQSPS